MRTVAQLLGHTAIVFTVAVLSSPGLVASGQWAISAALEDSHCWGSALVQEGGGHQVWKA